MSNRGDAHLWSSWRSSQKQNRRLLWELRMSWVMWHHLCITKRTSSHLKKKSFIITGLISFNAPEESFCIIIVYKTHKYHISITEMIWGFSISTSATSTLMKRREGGFQIGKWFDVYALLIFSPAECDPTQCVMTTVGCPLGFTQDMDSKQGDCCPTYTCSEYT